MNPSHADREARRLRFFKQRGVATWEDHQRLMQLERAEAERAFAAQEEREQPARKLLRRLVREAR